MATKKYLDLDGLDYYDGKVKTALAGKLATNGNAYRTLSIPYGECDSTSTSTVYTATVGGITELRDGVCMLLKNGVVTSATGFTIDINGLGAKPVYSNMAATTRESNVFNIDYTMLFVYDSGRVEGGCWVLYRGYFSDANSVGYQVRTYSSTLPALQTGYRYRLWLTSVDGQNYVPINTATGTSTTSAKSLNTTPIDPFGTIVYNSTNGTVEAGANLPTSTQWTQYTLDLRYAKYPLTTLTYPDPVYLQCTPQTTGGAVMNDIVQTLPTTEDGKIYIYLGNAYSAVSMELKQNHPVYYFKDGQIRLWTNAAATSGGSPTVVQTTGQSTTDVMSQKAVTDELALKADASSLATVATSGSYNDLSNKPTIPAAQVNSDWSANSGVAQILNKPTLATVATSGSYNDLTDKPTVMTGLVEMSYGESNAWAKFISAYQAGSIVYCRASSNANPATGSQTRKAFMAYVNNADNPTEVEFQYVRSVSTKTSSQPVDQVFVYKLTSASGGTWTVQTRNMAPKLAQGTNTTVSYSNGTYTISATQPTVNDATLTIQKNGTDVATFTANASSNVTANISVPTLYTTTGQNTDGAVTQKLFTDTVGNVETILQTLNNGGGAQ